MAGLDPAIHLQLPNEIWYKPDLTWAGQDAVSLGEAAQRIERISQ
jgi:hypothetical protein